MIEQALKWIRENGNPDNHFFTQQGELVILEHVIVQDKTYLVSDAFYYEHEEYYGDDCRTYDGVDYRKSRVYEGKLYTQESYNQFALVHPNVTALEKREKNLRTEIDELQKIKYELEQFKRGESKTFENMEVLGKIEQLISCTKRFIFVRPNSWNYYVIDNQDRTEHPYDNVMANIDEDDDSYYIDSHCFREVEFIVYRDFKNGGRSRPDESFFGYNIRVEREKKKNWGSTYGEKTDISMDKNGDITFHDTRDGVIEQALIYVREEKMKLQDFIQLSRLFKKELPEEITERLREQITRKLTSAVKERKQAIERSASDIVKHTDELALLKGMTTSEEILKHFNLY